MRRTLTLSVAALSGALMLTGCVRSGARTDHPPPTGPPPPGARPPGGLPAVVQQDLAAVGSALGPGYELARYGMPNPACWTVHNAPVKVKRRLTGAIESGAGWDTQLCLAEYVRRGTHEDLIFKVYVLSDPAAPQRLLPAPYFQRKAGQLQAGGYPRIETAPGLLFYLTGSPSNRQAAWHVMPPWSARLRSIAGSHR